MNYEDRLLRIAINAAPDAGQPAAATGAEPTLDPRTMSLVRLAALIALGGSVPSYSELLDAAISAGATPNETVDVLVGICDIVGSARLVDAAPKLAMALGYDIDDAMEASSRNRPPPLSPK